MDISLKWIPQRYPFILVDRVCELSDSYAKTEKLVSAGDVLTISENYLLENMAQSASALFGYRCRHHIPEVMYLAGIDEAKVERRPLPGEVMETEVELVIAIGGLARVVCRCFVVDENEEREMIGTGTLVLAVK